MSAFAQIQIDQILIWNAALTGHRLEVGNSLFVQANSELLLRLLHVRILYCLGKIVFLSHTDHLTYKHNYTVVGIKRRSEWRQESAKDAVTTSVHFGSFKIVNNIFPLPL